ncbi:hypothetical protein [Flavobacterium anhuiense]|uniref:hypothetical protein n=1 Tax=Flavobacterium anhuiense TaxID=459526 RepID=UPI001181C94D|nr:hypothetical protein [Flavobacterium anhuiense]
MLVLLFGCEKKKQEPIKKIKQADNIKSQCLPHLYDDPKLEKKKVVIHAEEYDSLLFSKNELNRIEKLFPVLKAEFPASPEEACSIKLWENYIDQNGKEQSITFSSEAGEDQFCLLYAYYLKQKNGEKKFKKERETLINLYQTINSIYWQLNYGGTYFGHQYKRLNASAEYSIYQLATGKEYYEKEYDFQKQKELYIKTIMQFVEDEESQNVYYQEDLHVNRKKANERAKELKDKINILEKLITNYFYLNQVQNFEITYYK